MNKCRHKFQARYDETENNTVSKLSAQTIYMHGSDLRDLVIVRRYVRDICVKCGKVINREPANL